MNVLYSMKIQHGLVEKDERRKRRNGLQAKAVFSFGSKSIHLRLRKRYRAADNRRGRERERRGERSWSVVQTVCISALMLYGPDRLGRPTKHSIFSPGGKEKEGAGGGGHAERNRLVRLYSDNTFPARCRRPTACC